MSAKFAAIIPYYQEEPGILRGAVISAIEQEGVSDLEIMVVDDGSPAPARDDLKGLDLPAHVSLKLIEQRNRGPGAARNRALDSVSPDTAYVAFLDSDDRWTSNHLRKALDVLNQGQDMYFADFLFSQREGTIFASAAMSQISVCVDETRHHHIFRDVPRKHLINPRSFIHTSTVVYRYGLFSDLRFPEKFALGEDTVFWLSIADRTNKIVFSSDVVCESGRGSHLWEDARWGEPRLVWRLHQHMLSRKWIGLHFSMEFSERQEHKRRMKKLRKSFVIASFHELRRIRGFKNRHIPAFVMDDPVVLLYVLPGLCEIVARKHKRRKRA